ncbi:unnamed protein product [Closterium sp. NIES-65]|nr:unnamed protein product [Closterium sp. NIES-65]
MRPLRRSSRNRSGASAGVPSSASPLLTAAWLLAAAFLWTSGARAQGVAVDSADWTTLVALRDDMSFLVPTRSPKVYWTAPDSCDSLFGVMCDGDGNVVSLSISGNLTSLPVELSSLSLLTVLNLELNQLSGSLPSGISALSSLSDLALSSNKVALVQSGDGRHSTCHFDPQTFENPVRREAGRRGGWGDGRGEGWERRGMGEERDGRSEGLEERGIGGAMDGR